MDRTSITPTAPSSAERIQQDRASRARRTSGSDSRFTRGGLTAPNGSTKAPTSIAAGRIQAARNRTKLASGDSSSVRPDSQRGGGLRTDRGAKGSVDAKERATLDAREQARAKRARQDYLDSVNSKIVPGGGLTVDGSTGGRNPGLDRGLYRPSSGPRGGISPGSGTGGGGLITPGSGNGRYLGGHNGGHGGHGGYDNRWHCGSAWSNFYWNWNVWGWGYGWGYCPAMWVSSYWWDSYWYYGGAWSYGYRPRFYYYGPLAEPQYQVIVQVVQEPLVEAQPAAAPAVGEAVAPAYEDGGGNGGGVGPVVVPAINRAAEYYLTLGDRAFQSGRYSDAVHHYGKAVEYSPGEGILYLILSDALFATSDYHYGAFALRRALELDPALVEITVNKRSFYGVPSDLDLQMTRARTFVLQNPTDQDALLMLIANELFTAQPERAVALLNDPANRAVAESAEGKLLMERARMELQSAPQTTPEGSDSQPIFEVDPVD
ncbi:MAG: hypothetical protein H6830_00060 [Planctomycetes bacterium]|nr:hypothetical protein [Planctomycetota bacterium]MCB9910727.1 hypothetical protein [Planctomycetota bacterium]MCB9912753.1 hypothetical protein [Planctomycetota bacterium]HPF14761.1 hypothetical protein [Planctomycetota bacterium]HRV81440.1 hypothetical protein [Planctomycetota bacterium]